VVLLEEEERKVQGRVSSFEEEKTKLFCKPDYHSLKK
jgi:hypothetical protein